MSDLFNNPYTSSQLPSDSQGSTGVPLPTSRDMSFDEREQLFGPELNPRVPNSLPNPERTKVNILASKRAAKEARLITAKGLNENDLVDNREIVVEDEFSGNKYIHPTHNKIFNDYTPDELDALEKGITDKYKLTEIDGKWYNRDAEGRLAEFKGNLEDYGVYYVFKGKGQDGYATTKYGIWNGSLNGKDRYDINKFLKDKSKPGPSGVDVDQQEENWVIPREIANILEGMRHGSKHMIPHRAVLRAYHDSNSPEFEQSERNYAREKAAFGGGHTEYYYDTHKFMGQADQNRENLIQDFINRFDLDKVNQISIDNHGYVPSYESEEDRIAAISAKWDAIRESDKASRRTDFVDRSFNVSKAFLSSAALEGLVNPLDAILDLAGNPLGLDLGTEESKREGVYKFFDYDARYSQEAAESVKQSVTNLYEAALEGGQFHWADVGNILYQSFMNPEMLAESLGAVGAMAVGTGRISAGGRAIKGIEASAAAGRVTAAEAKAAVALEKKAMSVSDSLKYHVGLNAGFLAVIMGQTNDNIEQFKENNNGQADLGQMAAIFAATTVAASFDRFSAATIMKDVPFIRSSSGNLDKMVKEAQKVLDNIPAETRFPALQAMSKAAITVGKATGDAVLEGGTEILQETLETYATEAGSAKVGGAGIFELLQDKDKQIELLTAGALGAVQGPEMGAINKLVGAVGTGVGSLRDRVTGVAEIKAAQAAAQNRELTPEEEASKKYYNEKLEALRTAVVDGTLTVEKLPQQLEDLLDLRTYVESMKSYYGPEKANKIRETLNALEDSILDFIIDNTDGNVDLAAIYQNIMGESVSEAQQELDAISAAPANALDGILEMVNAVNETGSYTVSDTKLQDLIMSSEDVFTFTENTSEDGTTTLTVTKAPALEAVRSVVDTYGLTADLSSDEKNALINELLEAAPENVDSIKQRILTMKEADLETLDLDAPAVSETIKRTVDTAVNRAVSKAKEEKLAGALSSEEKATLTKLTQEEKEIKSTLKRLTQEQAASSDIESVRADLKKVADKIKVLKDKGVLTEAELNSIKQSKGVDTLPAVKGKASAGSVSNAKKLITERKERTEQKEAKNKQEKQAVEKAASNTNIDPTLKLLKPAFIETLPTHLASAAEKLVAASKDTTKAKNDVKKNKSGAGRSAAEAALKIAKERQVRALKAYKDALINSKKALEREAKELAALLSTLEKDLKDVTEAESKIAERKEKIAANRAASTAKAKYKKEEKSKSAEPADTNEKEYSPFEVAEEDAEITETEIKTREKKKEEAVEEKTAEQLKEEALTKLKKRKKERLSAAEVEAHVEQLVSRLVEKKQGKLSDKDKTVLNSFAKANGLSEAFVENLVVNYETVEQEAWFEERGVKKRTARLRNMLSSGDVDTTSFRIEYNGTAKFYTATVESIQALTAGLEAAKAEANKQNRASEGKGVEAKRNKAIKITTKYKKLDDTFFTINVVHDGSKWVVQEDIVNKNLEHKLRVKEGLAKALIYAHNHGAEHLKESDIVSFDEYVVTGTPDKSGKGGVATEKAYLENTSKALKEAGFERTTPNRVILGNNTAKYWGKGTVRRRVNSGITNIASSSSGKYSSSDVVVLNDHSYTTVGGKKKVSSAYVTDSVVSQELKAAMEAGATIVLDSSNKRGMGKAVKHKDGTTTFDSAGNRHATYLKSKGYFQLSEHKGSPGYNVFVKDNEVAEAFNAKQNAELDEKAAAAKLKSERMLSSVTLYNELKAAEAGMADSRDIDIISAELAEANALLEEYFEAAAFNQSVREARDLLADEVAMEEFADIDTSALEVVNRLTEEEQNEIASFSELDENAVELAKADLALLNIDVNANTQEKIHSYLANNLNKVLREAVSNTNLRTENEALVESNDASLNFLIGEAVKSYENASKNASLMAHVWKDLSRLKLGPAKLIAAMKERIKDSSVAAVIGTVKNPVKGGINFGEQAHAVLHDAVGANFSTKYYNVQVAEYDSSGKLVARHTYTPFFSNKDLVPGRYLKSATKGTKGNKQVIEAVNELTANPTDFLTISREMPLGTIPVDQLPETFRTVAEETAEALIKGLPALENTERNFDEGFSGQDRSGIFNMTDSPARALLYQRDGTIHPSMALAVGVAVRDLINRNKFKLMPGPKDNDTIAAMFGIREEEITQAHREFVKDHGGLHKTSADALGRSILRSLGIRNKNDNEVSRGQYQRLASDLGSIAIIAAEQQGLLEVTQVSSNEMSKLYSDGEVRYGEKGKAETSFINIPTKVVSEGTIKRRVPEDKANKGIKEFKAMDEFFPDMTGSLKRPTIGSAESTEEARKRAKKKATSTVKNTDIGATPPDQAKEAIEGFMDTPFQLNETVARQIVRSVTEGTPEDILKAKRVYGYIEISEDNPEYAALMYDDKLLQEVINDNIDRELESLADLISTLDSIPEGESKDIWFDYFYTSNHRYNVDSNTVNFQASHVHRFAVSPVGHTTKYSIGKNHTFKHSFKVKNSKGKYESKTIDSSFYIRAALAQAFGFGIDKLATTYKERENGKVKDLNTVTKDNIVSIGNAILSLPAEELSRLKNAIINGEHLNSDTAPTIIAADGSSLVLKPDHAAAALQAIDFLESYAAALEIGAKTMEHNLTFEIDVLTSGYNNKIQQFALIGDLITHAKRVGHIQKDSPLQDRFRTNQSLKDSDVPYGMNDLLSESDNVDSYQNLGKKTISGVKTKEADLKGEPKRVFDGIKHALPGYDQIGKPEADMIISKALRDMFKPPFMIFNYAASISRIIKELGKEMSMSMIKNITGKTFTDKDIGSADFNAALTLAGVVVFPGEKATRTIGKTEADKVKAVNEFVKALRTHPLSSFKVPSTSISSVSGVRSKTTNTPLLEYLAEEILIPTYGAAVKETFETEFSEFIAIQNVTNDTFKQSFKVFDHLLHQKVAELRRGRIGEAGNVVVEGKTKVTDQDILDIIKSLSDVFPAIVGPLLGTIEDGQGIAVISSNTATPEGSMATVPYASTKKTGSTKSRIVHPLLRSITMAANAGAVLPFHAIDGAQMATTMNSFLTHFYSNIEGAEGLGSVTMPIHDAVLTKLPLTDILARIYNINTAAINSSYSIIKELQDLNNRVKDVIDGKHPDLKVDPAKIDVMGELTVGRATAELVGVQENTEKHKAVKEARKNYNKVKNSLKSKSDDKKTDAEKAALQAAETQLAAAQAEVSFKSDFDVNTTILNHYADQVEAARKEFHNNSFISSPIVSFAAGINYGETDYVTADNAFDEGVVSSFTSKLEKDYAQVDVHLSTADGKTLESTANEPTHAVNLDLLEDEKNLVNLGETKLANGPVDAAILPAVTHLLFREKASLADSSYTVMKAEYESNKEVSKAPYNKNSVVYVVPGAQGNDVALGSAIINAAKQKAAVVMAISSTTESGKAQNEELLNSVLESSGGTLSGRRVSKEHNGTTYEYVVLSTGEFVADSKEVVMYDNIVLKNRTERLMQSLKSSLADNKNSVVEQQIRDLEALLERIDNDIKNHCK